MLSREELIKAMHSLTGEAFFQAPYDPNAFDLSTCMAQYTSHAQQYEDQVNAKQRLVVEQYQLMLLQHIHATLTGKAIEKETQQQYLWWRQLALWICMPIAMSFNAIGEFIYANEATQIIPDASRPVQQVLAGVITFISSLLFYSFEIQMLKKALGLKYSLATAAAALEILTKKIATTVAIRAAFTNNDNLGAITTEQYVQIKDFIIAREKEIADLKTKFKPSSENLLIKFSKGFVVAFGAMMSLAGGYFFAKQLLLLLLPSLLISPYGWIIIGAAMLVSLSLYAAMRASGMMSMANPAQQKSRELEIELNKFEPKTEDKWQRNHTAFQSIKAAQTSADTVTLRQSHAVSRQSLPSKRLPRRLSTVNMSVFRKPRGSSPQDSATRYFAYANLS